MSNMLYNSREQENAIAHRRQACAEERLTPLSRDCGEGKLQVVRIEEGCPT